MGRRVRGIRGQLTRTAAQVLRVCELREGERVVILVDNATAPMLRDAFSDAIESAGSRVDPVVVSVRTRRPAFADLPPQAVEALLAADLVIDLTTVPWLYSDSFTGYVQECRSRGSRLAMVWGMGESLRTIAACPPSETLASRARRGLAALNGARTLRLWGEDGTDFVAELGDPSAYPRGFIGEPPVAAGMIGAPLCASVTAPFVPGTARGTLVFAAAGRFQGPENLPVRSRQPVVLTIDSGQVVEVAGTHAAALALADWFASGPTGDVFTVMDCNIGFDPRAKLDWADNTVVHSYAGGVMVGMGNPYVFRPEGSLRSGYHLDLMFPGLDVDLDDRPFIRAGEFVPESGIQ